MGHERSAYYCRRCPDGIDDATFKREICDNPNGDGRPCPALRRKDEPAELDIKCPECGTPIRYYYEAYCKLGCRGANTHCSTHHKELLCLACGKEHNKSRHERFECKWTVSKTPRQAYDYQTACGKRVVFAEGGPKANGYKFCPHCGRRVVRR